MIMGVLNVTPDSFSDGGAFTDPDRALEQALALVAEGADIIDIGGESTRPGAESVGAEEELRRVEPVVRALRARSEVLISVDTSKAAVAEAALAAGADIINDVTALVGDAAMPEVARKSGAGVVLMHMQGNPRTMQAAPHYENVVEEVAEFLRQRMEAVLALGMAAESVAIDPGIGFGKTLSHNLDLLRGTGRLAKLGRPVLIGVSRKSFLGKMGLGKDLEKGDGETAPSAGRRQSGIAAASQFAAETSDSVPVPGDGTAQSAVATANARLEARSNGEREAANGSVLSDRFWQGVALTSFCRERGARIFRVHEAKPHREALRMTEAVLGDA